MKTDVALLKQSEEQRDKKLRDATHSLSKSLKELESDDKCGVPHLPLNLSGDVQLEANGVRLETRYPVGL